MGGRKGRGERENDWGKWGVESDFQQASWEVDLEGEGGRNKGERREKGGKKEGSGS